MSQNNKLYVGNLPYTATEEEIQELFAQAGTVESTAIISDKFSGRSKGFGFVEMSSAEEVQKAVEMFDGSDMGGRNLRVNEARPKTERPQGDFGGDRY